MFSLKKINELIYFFSNTAIHQAAEFIITMFFFFFFKKNGFTRQLHQLEVFINHSIFTIRFNYCNAKGSKVGGAAERFSEDRVLHCWLLLSNRRVRRCSFNYLRLDSTTTTRCTRSSSRFFLPGSSLTFFIKLSNCKDAEVGCSGR